jgi:uncharacterized protein YjbI with pentapeptide repeats
MVVALIGAGLAWLALRENGNLTRANLTGANLSGGNLTGVDLVLANLSGPNLTDADLHTALDLTQPLLDGACGSASTKLPEALAIKIGDRHRWPPCTIAFIPSCQNRLNFRARAWV